MFLLVRRCGSYVSIGHNYYILPGLATVDDANFALDGEFHIIKLSVKEICIKRINVLLLTSVFKQTWVVSKVFALHIPPMLFRELYNIHVYGADSDVRFCKWL